MRRFPIIAGFALLASAPAMAANGDPIEASGDSLQASAQITGELVASGLPVALGAAVIVAGSGAAIATGEEDFAEHGFRAGTAILNTPLDENGALPLSPDIIIAAPPPDVPFDSASEPQKGEAD